ARTAAQVQSGKDRQITNASGLLARWSFNEWGGPVFNFQSEPGNRPGMIAGNAAATAMWNWMLVPGAPFTSPTNRAPQVDAGADQTVGFGMPASLHGSVTDDGSPSGTLTITWTKASGPGTVTFADEHAAETTATFSERGTYVLTLSADDGEASASDSVTITVESRPVAVDDSYSV